MAEVKRILTALEFQVEPHGSGGIAVTVPPNRLDIQVGAADSDRRGRPPLRLRQLPATLLADPLPAQLGCADLEREERVRDRLVTLGLQEVITYSLTTPERERRSIRPPAII